MEREKRGQGLSGAGRQGGKHSSCWSGSSDSFITTTRFMAVCVCVRGGRGVCVRRNRRSNAILLYRHDRIPLLPCGGAVKTGIHYKIPLAILLLVHEEFQIIM